MKKISYKLTYEEYVHILDGLSALYWKNESLPDFTEKKENDILTLKNKILQLAESVKK